MRRAAGDAVPRPRVEPERGGSVVRSSLLRFAVISIGVAVLLTLATLVVADRIAQSHAVDDAQRLGTGIARRVAAPLVDADVRAGRAGATSQLTTVMTNRMQDGSVQHAKIWDRDGRVIWSDEQELVGRRYELSDEVSSLFGTTGTSVDLSELSREENVLERQEGQLLEVYVGAFDADGEPLVVELYLSTEPMEENARTIVTAFVPVVVGSLLVFLAVVVPLAVSLSRRVEHAQREHARMMRHAVLASDLERRRVAEDLHNGVVQELVGLGYSLPSVARQLEPDGDFALGRRTLSRATDLVQRNVAALRSLMTDLYPPDLRGEGLREAVRQLVTTEAHGAGLEAEVRIEEDLELPLEAGRLAYRVIREGLRNVIKHAEAARVWVELGCYEQQVMVRVVDDGHGPGAGPVTSPQGHLGLRLLTDTVLDVGGTLAITEGPVGGTSLVAQFPVELPH